MPNLQYASKVVKELIAERVSLAAQNQITTEAYWKKPQYLPSLAGERQNAIRMLGEIGTEQAFEMLLDVLKILRVDYYSIEGDKGLKEAATEALAQVTHGSVEPLIPLLSNRTLRSVWHDVAKTHGSDDIRQVIMGLLERNGSERARDALTTVLNDESQKVRESALYALARLGDARAIPRLMELVISESGSRRGHAISALGELGAMDVIPLLLIVLSENPKASYIDEYDPQEQAVRVLTKFGWRPGQDEIGIKYYLLSNQLDKCLEIGEPAIAHLISLLRINRVKSKAVGVLEKMGATAVEPLCTALKDDAQALPQHPPKSPFPGAYVEGENLYWERARFRESIAGILGNIADARAVGTLNWVSNNDPHVVNLLEDEEIAARDDTWPVREAARDALEKIANNSEKKT